MAGRGMGIATQGGGAVSSGPRNKKLSAPSKKIIVMMKKGGEVKKRKSSDNSDLISQHKRLAMGEKVTGYQAGGGIGRTAADSLRRQGPSQAALARQAARGQKRSFGFKTGGEVKKRKGG